MVPIGEQAGVNTKAVTNLGKTPGYDTSNSPHPPFLPQALGVEVLSGFIRAKLTEALERRAGRSRENTTEWNGKTYMMENCQ